MARSTDEIVRDTLGNQSIEIIRLLAQVEDLQEKLAAAQKPNPQPTPDPAP